MESCPYCNRPLAGEICPAHGYVGQNIDKEVQIPTVPVEFPVGMIALIQVATSSTPCPTVAGWKVCDGNNGTPKFHANSTSAMAIGSYSNYAYYMKRIS